MVAAVSRVVSGTSNAEDPKAEAGQDLGVDDGCVRILTEQGAHPCDTFAVHDMVGSDHGFDAGNTGHVTADYDGGMRRD